MDFMMSFDISCRFFESAASIQSSRFLTSSADTADTVTLTVFASYPVGWSPEPAPCLARLGIAVLRERASFRTEKVFLRQPVFFDLSTQLCDDFCQLRLP
jgi:hypothetical protein